MLQTLKLLQWEKDYVHNPPVAAVPWLWAKEIPRRTRKNERVHFSSPRSSLVLPQMYLNSPRWAR